MQSCNLHLETIAAKKFVVIVFPNFSRPVSRRWWPCTGACTSHWTVQKVSRRSLLPSLVSWSVRSKGGGISRYCGSTNNIRSVCVRVFGENFLLKRNVRAPCLSVSFIVPRVLCDHETHQSHGSRAPWCTSIKAAFSSRCVP